MSKQKIVDELTKQYGDSFEFALTDGIEKDMVTVMCMVEPERVITIPEGVERIADMAFGKTYVNTVTFPETLKEVGTEAFRCVYQLREAKLPDSVVHIGDKAFWQCVALRKVHIPKSLTEIGEGVFAYCRSLHEVSLPESVVRIGKEAFTNCDSLAKINLQNVESIGQFAFYDCYMLRSVTLEKLREISESAFHEASVQQLVLPGTCECILPIEELSMLSNVNMPDYVIGGNGTPETFRAEFANADGVSAITFEEGCADITLVLNKYQQLVVQLPQSAETLTITSKARFGCKNPLLRVEKDGVSVIQRTEGQYEQQTVHLKDGEGIED